MNAPVYPKSLAGTTLYHVVTEEGAYNDETEQDDPDTTTVTAGTVLGISLDGDGDFFFLVEKADGTLESWCAILCKTIEPEATT